MRTSNNIPTWKHPHRESHNINDVLMVFEYFIVSTQSSVMAYDK